VPLVKSLWATKARADAVQSTCASHVFGRLPANTDENSDVA
jgi:hypothetical protein